MDDRTGQFGTCHQKGKGSASPLALVHRTVLGKFLQFLYIFWSFFHFLFSKMNFFRLGGGCLSQCCIAVKRLHDQSNSYERKHFFSLVNYHHEAEHGAMQADMVLERQLQLYIQICRQQEERVTGLLKTSQPILVTYVL